MNLLSFYYNNYLACNVIIVEVVLFEVSISFFHNLNKLFVFILPTSLIQGITISLKNLLLQRIFVFKALNIKLKWHNLKLTSSNFINTKFIGGKTIMFNKKVYCLYHNDSFITNFCNNSSNQMT